MQTCGCRFLQAFASAVVCQLIVSFFVIVHALGIFVATTFMANKSKCFRTELISLNV